MSELPSTAVAEPKPKPKAKPVEKRGANKSDLDRVKSELDKQRHLAHQRRLLAEKCMLEAGLVAARNLTGGQRHG